jgi:hypothetical protein
VFVYDRGGKTRLAEITKLTLVRWNRVRDDISEATIQVNGLACQEQAPSLENIQPGRHEIVIFRGQDRVWEGPVTRTEFTSDSVEIHAQDVLYYTNRTVMHAGYSNANPNIDFVTNRIYNILVAELARKEALTPALNVVPFIVNHHTPNDAKTSAVTVPYQYSVWEHLDSLAARNGIDYCTVGRAIHIWDTHERLGQTATVSDADFLGDITVSTYGSELATRAIVTDGQGNAGIAGGIDPYYGEWETLATAFDEETDDGPPPGQAALESQAKRNLSGRKPTPLMVRIPDNSSLNPLGVLRLIDLVPGVYIPLRSDSTIKTIKQMQKLDSVTVEETAEGENIMVTMYPAAGDDGVVEG